MFIVHIANVDTSVIGGVQTAVPQMIKAQSKYADVGLINTNGDVIDGINMLEYSILNGNIKIVGTGKQPDLIVFHEVYRFEFIKIYKLLKAARISYVIIPHGCLSRQAQKRKWVKKKIANILIFNRFVGSSNCIQYLSENEMCMSIFQKYPSFVGKNGIELPTQRKEVFSENGIKFLYIGRLEIKTKGLDILLGAVKECSHLMRRTGAKLEIYGPSYNGEYDVLNNIVNEYSIADIVNLNTEIVGKDKMNVILSADCFIQASRTEGLPLGVLEALGYGVPCIVTEGVGIGNLVESYNAGYQCETSSAGVSEAIRKFISECENRKEMSNAAIDLIRENFEIDLTAKNMVKTYTQMINK